MNKRDLTRLKQSALVLATVARGIKDESAKIETLEMVKVIIKAVAELEPKPGTALQDITEIDERNDDDQTH
jgi:hypothetical protein